LSTPNEARTRKELIDPALKRAGWDVEDHTKVRVEIPVDGFDPQAWQVLSTKLKHIQETGPAYNLGLPAGISDYALYRPNGEIIAIVEAKRTSTDARIAQTQAEFYIDQIGKRQSFRPFAFMANGHDVYFWEKGSGNKRQVAGFFSPDDLETLLYVRQNKLPLTSVPIQAAITDRLYQQEAIRRVGQAFEMGKRRTLLVMATGTGKTRVATSLVDVLLRANQARRVLFVADRDELVKQALTDGFRAFLPDEPSARIFSYDIDQTKRLYVVTLQTLNSCYQAFTPAFFDVIIFDEVHRSIFNKWSEVLQYFDARMIGLTATPADYMDRNTFLAFDCPGGVPTFVYSYKQAVHDGYLVDYSLYKARTRFQRQGIRGVDLSEEERNALIEQGIDPDEIDFSGTELERSVSNRDTLRKQWEEIWDVCLRDQSGQLPGKTIVFAMTQDHALRLAEVFDEMYPQYPDLLRVITYQSDYKGQLIARFKKQDMPRIAITVDLLETGIDVPEAVNLVFMKPIQSRIKLEQMIGRGTRSHAACHYFDRLPDGCKREFLVIDFWENDFNKSAEEEVAQSVPVLVSIFNTRLRLLEHYLSDQGSAECRRTLADVRAQIALIPVDSFSVKKMLPQVQAAWEESFWKYLTEDKLEFLKLRVGPLLRFAPGVDVQAATFTSKVERLKLQILTNKDTAGSVASIAEDVSRLPEFVADDGRAGQSISMCLSPTLATASPSQLDQVVDTLAEQMKNRREQPSSFLLLDLPDFIEMHGYILLKGGTERVYVEEYRRRVEQRAAELAAKHPTLLAIEHGEPVSDEQLIELERTLRQELGGPEIELSQENVRKAYGYKVDSLLAFLRRLLDLPALPDYRDVVKRQFEHYIAGRPFNGDQIRFMQAVQNAFLRKGRLQTADLYEPPLTNFGDDAADRWFTTEEVQDMLAFTDRLAV